MAILNFPVKPGGTLVELWNACMDLAQQLSSLLFVSIKEQAVGTSETPIAHGQSFVPSICVPVARANVAVWQSSQPDNRFCYLTAASPVVVDVKVFR